MALMVRGAFVFAPARGRRTPYTGLPFRAGRKARDPAEGGGQQFGMGGLCHLYSSGVLNHILRQRVGDHILFVFGPAHFCRPNSCGRLSGSTAVYRSAYAVTLRWRRLDWWSVPG